MECTDAKCVLMHAGLGSLTYQPLHVPKPGLLATCCQLARATRSAQGFVHMFVFAAFELYWACVSGVLCAGLDVVCQ